MQKTKLTHGSLFSGIGGFDLAAEWMGWENIFHCEWNEFGRKILNHYWPKAISYEDITKTDFTVHRGHIDILTGGFPCQPYSLAGKRKGKEDERHLWPEMLRAIREIAPRNVVGENVGGLVSWNGGMVFDEVQTDLEDEGYEVIPFILPAAGVNAPHKRDRIWFIANSKSKRRSSGKGKDFDGNRARGFQKSITHDRDTVRNGLESISISQPIADPNGSPKRPSRKSDKTDRSRRKNNDESSEWRGETEQYIGCDIVQQTSFNSNGERLEEFDISRESKESKFNNWRYNAKSENWQNFPTQSPVCFGDDGISSRLDAITFPKWRNESIKASGNAIVPQVAYQIFKALTMVEVKTE